MINTHKIKGFTLLELILTLALTGTVTLAIFSFFLSSYQTFSMSNDQIEVQNQAQIAISKFIEPIMWATEIADINSENSNLEFIELEKLTLKTGDEYNQFVFDKAQKKLMYAVNQNQNHLSPTVYATNIISVQYKELKDKHNNIIGLGIKVVSEVKESKVEIENEIYFRNKIK
ncbi:hypothetical protein SAMN00017405_0311 [Desulfonispora thiosulfatigenes DSM 11270]|uniref:Prepilin-type N-terminal cleavage/methylation domain-containing protein n=1 Tax=Desulfonispora thiosulfatigenes DSM 11270 TaxID=656914 RepID=A0A1W1VNW5_DESTI|nr:hypothetical protein [Desulfonispora thiosulfatigenes]SMB95016.1 hypothetical protein SAMN00017405_0311 [Desulfonispora thiosulfatigenes DSM 11270]